MAKKNEIIIKITCIIAAFALWFYISNTENPAMDHDPTARRYIG